MTDINLISEKELFSFWENLPVLKTIPLSDFQSIMSPVRLEILDILQKGIESKYKGRITFRHALTANEIRKRVKSDQISYNNIYFHIEKMEEINVIMTLGHIKNGKRFTSYFARTARTFVPKDQDDLGYLEAIRMKELPNLIKRFSPEIYSNKIETIIENIETINSPNLENYQIWLETNIHKFDNLEIDFRKIMELYYVIQNLNPKFVNAINELGKLLLIKSY